jgi:cytochrome bd-type quinol oxidase subunit 2
MRVLDWSCDEMGRGIARYLGRLRTGGWIGTAIFLAIALVTLAVLSYLFKKSDPSHLTKGAAFVTLLYLTACGFMVLASRIFPKKRGDSQ